MIQQGNFVHFGQDPIGPSPDGFGQSVTVEQLEALHRSRIRAQLDAAKPDTFTEGVRIYRTKLESDAAIEKLRQLLQNTVGGDNGRVAAQMMAEEAQKQIRADEARARTVEAKLGSKK